MVSLAVTTLGIIFLAGVRVEARLGDVRAISQGQQAANIDGHNYMAFSQLRRLAGEFFDHYPNLTQADLYQDARIPSAQDLQCLADFAVLTKDLRNLKIWALKMIDSWGTLPSGVLVGNWWDLGHFDECLGIDHPDATTGRHVRGKYCFAKIVPAPSVSQALVMKTALCFPASCSAANMDTLLSRLFQTLLNVEIGTGVQIVDETTCQTAESKSYDGVTVFTIVLLSILAAAVGLATCYDYFLVQDEKSLPPVVRAFSARANSRSLFRLVDTKANPNVIDCLHGIRCLSFIWVVFCHDYLVFAMSPNMNMTYVLTWIDSVFSLFVKHGVYAVDSFFFLSGLLLVVIALRSMDRTKGRLNIPMMYLLRYLRLTPLLAIAILIYMKILPLMGSGPLHGTVGFDDYSVCKDTWYLTLLYVQNVATDRLCISHSWYLAVDMQLYIFAPFLLIALYKWGKKAAAGIFVLLMLLACCLFSIMVINDLSLGAQGGESMRKLYYATNTRASPYLIGLLFGYFLHLKRGQVFRLSRLAVLVGWLVSLSLLATCIFAVYGQNTLPIVEEAFYVTLTRIAWPLGLCWLVFACMHGYGGLASELLSSPLWQPMSKLSYSAYIFHMFIECLNGGLTRTNTYFSDYQVMLRFWSDFGFTMLLAYLMHILVEAPLAHLQSLLLPTKSQQNPRPKEAPSLAGEAAVQEAPVKADKPKKAEVEAEAPPALH
ncbi:nose resistant to fluoxetine protein 6-like [Drosophila kikkawai]|uniref:Nose resistant to fluoxetine protein 6-like n=1 Tax=Drosophila kikkawai TaxID=30033 RepID=A0A6P4IZP8_DROKI|nr:nose resistant to fluoxetine protein 6-like [Drosophila kikkawai]